MSSALSKNTQANAGSTAPSVSAADSASSAIAVAASGTTNGHDASAANATGNGTGSPTAIPTGNPTGDSGYASYAGYATTNAAWNALGCPLLYANWYGHAADGYVHDPWNYVGVIEWELKLEHQYICQLT